MNAGSERLCNAAGEVDSGCARLTGAVDLQRPSRLVSAANNVADVLV
jgi:hypothetical protein